MIFEMSDIRPKPCEMAFGAGHHCIVAVGRREMGEHLAAINPLPDECSVPGFVETIPRKLLRQEAFDSRQSHNLRKLPVVAKNVGIPELFATNSKFAIEIPLPDEELPAQRFARRDIAVRLNPCAAHHDPLPGFYSLLDAAVQIGIAILYHRVLICLRACKAELGIITHIRGYSAEGALALAVCLCQRP